MYNVVLISYLVILGIIFFLWPLQVLCVAKWTCILGVFVLLCALVVWLSVGKNLFLWPVPAHTAPGFQRIVTNDLVIMDSSNPDAKDILVLLPGTCSPLPGSRKHHQVLWARRMLAFIKLGFRVYLVQHRYRVFGNNLETRIRDVHEVMLWLHKGADCPSSIPQPGLSLPRIVLLGDGYGATVAVKWLATLSSLSEFPRLSRVLCTEAQFTLSSGLKHIFLPSWLHPTNEQDEVHFSNQ